MRTAKPARPRQIIDAAAQLFAERLYHEVRMDDVAAHARVSKGTLYTYFKDKEALYLALTKDGLDRLVERIEGGLTDAPTPEEKVLAFARESLRFFDRHFHWLELIQRAEILRTNAGASPLRASRAKLHELLLALMNELNSTGRFVVDDPAIAALALLGMTREIVRFHPRPWPEELAHGIARQFLNGVGRRPEGISGSKPPAAAWR